MTHSKSNLADELLHRSPELSTEKQDPSQLVKASDFCFMREGVCLSLLSKTDQSLLYPIVQKKQTSGRALLLLHGFASSPAVYRAIIHEVSAYDAIFCPSLPGHAQSFSAFSAVKADEWLSFVTSKFDEIALHYSEIDVMGLSLGGLLACHLAKQRSIHHLYLLAPALSLKNIPKVSCWLSYFLRQIGVQSIANRGGNLLNTEYADLMFKKLPLSAIQEIFQLIRKFEFTKLTCPTTVFLGKYDKVVNNQKVYQILSDLPVVDIKWLNRSAHLLPLDYDRQIIIDTLNASVCKTS